MSADRYDFCPACRKVALDVPFSSTSDLSNTLREEWDIGILHEQDPPVFMVEYEAKCRECGWKYHYTVEVPIALDPKEMEKVASVKTTALQVTLSDGTKANFYPMVFIIDDRLSGKKESLECYSDHFTWNEYSCTDDEALAFIKRMAKYYEDYPINGVIQQE